MIATYWLKDEKLILGGVEIPHKTGLLGHSDADALLHAITDALLVLRRSVILENFSQIPMPALPVLILGLVARSDAP